MTCITGQEHYEKSKPMNYVIWDIETDKLVIVHGEGPEIRLGLP